VSKVSCSKNLPGKTWNLLISRLGPNHFKATLGQEQYQLPHRVEPYHHRCPRVHHNTTIHQVHISLIPNMFIFTLYPLYDQVISHQSSLHTGQCTVIITTSSFVSWQQNCYYLSGRVMTYKKLLH